MDTRMITALYERLSRDDDLEGESNSISNQKRQLEDYARSQGFPNAVHFTDDGISGTCFDRPRFLAMMKEVEAGRVEYLLIKDMSRLGRDYLKVGQIMEILRQKGVRLIAINDGVDSARGDDDFTPFRNIMNEYYARDTSRKIRSTFQSKGKSGKHVTGLVIYGYLWNETRDQWLVDEYAAGIVKRIFAMTIEGMGPYQIANRLKAEKVLISSAYLATHNEGVNKNKTFKDVYGILRFAKYKGPEIGHIEAHNERKKEKYASNPDVKTELSKNNFHLIEPGGKYRAEAERQIAQAGCRTRKDSVRIVETLITASPEFFQGKSDKEIRAYFERALEFMKTKQDPSTFVSAVVHMDEKTPHMHLCFVPITEDGRLSAKDIVGNKKKLAQWQDEYWSYMVKKYPDLERGESASETGRTHLPPRIFKQATKMHRLEQKLRELLSSINPMNAKKIREEILKILDDYIPGVAELMTKTKALKRSEKELIGEIAVLKKEANANKPSVQRLLELERKVQGQEELQRTIASLQQTLTAIPPEIIAEYNEPKLNRKEPIAIE